MNIIETPYLIDTDIQLIITQEVNGTNKIPPKLPGPMPVNLGRANLHVLNRSYMVAEKSDGVRRIMFIGTDKIVMVERSWQMFKVDDRLAEIICPIFEGKNVLLDGELVNYDNIDDEAGRKAFIMHDVILYDGANYTSVPFITRYELVRDTIVRLIYEVQAYYDRFDLIFQYKYFAPAQNLLEIVDKIRKTEGGVYVFFYPQLAYRNKNDGLIFVDAESHYLPQNQESLLKWKWPEKISVDFKIKGWSARKYYEQGRLELYARGFRDADVLVREIPRESYMGTLEDVFKRKENFHIVECFYKNGRWVIDHIRRDKIDANSVQVAFATLESIADNITIYDLLRTI